MGVLIGFAIIVAVIGVGYLVGRFQLLGPHADHVLSRLAFFVLSPALLFTVLSEADVTHLFSALLPISAIAAGVDITAFLAVALLVWRRSLPVCRARGEAAVRTGSVYLLLCWCSLPRTHRFSGLSAVPDDTSRSGIAGERSVSNLVAPPSR